MWWNNKTKKKPRIFNKQFKSHLSIITKKNKKLMTIIMDGWKVNILWYRLWIKVWTDYGWTCIKDNFAETVAF